VSCIPEKYDAMMAFDSHDHTNLLSITEEIISQRFSRLEEFSTACTNDKDILDSFIRHGLDKKQCTAEVEILLYVLSYAFPSSYQVLKLAFLLPHSPPQQSSQPLFTSFLIPMSTKSCSPLLRLYPLS
jgi:hypothetical protein